MYIERSIDKELLAWKSEADRKPLLIRGARQVGKSTAVKNLAKHFDYFIEINFDEQPAYKSLFDQALDLNDFIEQLALLTQTEIIEGKTLLFFDEIQACIPAISKLRYFYEKKPGMHVIAAGSLLEFALEELPSFGVGRVRSIFMYPLSFHEFLGALAQTKLVELIETSSSKQPITPLLHDKLKNYVKKYLIIGGMPQAVSAYALHGDLLKVQRILDDLLISIQADFVKYKKQISPQSIQVVFNSVVQQVGNKFKFTNDHSSLSNAVVKQVLNLLEMAGLVHPVVHSSSNGIPLGAQINPKKIKMLLFDTGIYQRILGLDIAALLLQPDTDVVNKGNIAELFVGLELLKYSSCYQKTTLHYWQREAKNSQAEVDYVLQVQERIIPLEVKAGTKGAMQSMHLFLAEKKVPSGLRLSLENFSAFEQINVLPLYAVSNCFTIVKNV